MGKFDKDYAESLETRILDYYSYEDEYHPKVLAKKSDTDDTYGMYTSFYDEDYRLECTDETIDVYLVICDSAFNDEYREKMWETLVEEAMTHGFKKTLPNLSKVSDDDLLAELRQRGLV